MARYERDYGRDYGMFGGEGRRRPGGRQSGGQFGGQIGGMRSDGWGGGSNWRNFAGEEGWFGEGYAGMPNFGYDESFRGDEWTRNAGDQGSRWQGYGRQEEMRGRGGFGGGYDSGYPGRQMGGYAEGWDDRDSFGRGGQSGQRSQTRAAEIMTENPQTVAPDTPISEVAQLMRDMDVGIIPVVDGAENRRLRGVITDRDIAIRAVAEGKDGNARVSDCMTSDVRTVNKNDSVRDVMRVMRQEQIRRVPVTDREGRLVGIIAQADLAVDYSGENRDSEFTSTVERISEPAEPQRGGNRMAASGGREREQEEESGSGSSRGSGRSRKSNR